MTSAVAELDGYLQAMLGLKPPGVSGSKITAITSLCTANVQVSLSDSRDNLAVLVLCELVLISAVLLSSPSPSSSRRYIPTSSELLEHTSWAYSMS